MPRCVCRVVHAARCPDGSMAGHTSKVVMGMKFAGHVVDSNLIEACDNVCGSWQLYAYMHNAAGQQPQLQSCGNVHVVLQDYTLYQ
jgi:hypothetical protein